MTARLCRRCRAAPPSSARTISQILSQARYARPEIRPAVLEIITEHALCAAFGMCHPCGRDAARAALPSSRVHQEA